MGLPDLNFTMSEVTSPPDPDYRGVRLKLMLSGRDVQVIPVILRG